MVRARTGSINAIFFVVPILIIGLLLRRPIASGVDPTDLVAASTLIEAPATAKLLTGAADALEEALSSDGQGFRFEVVARSTLYARPEGPRIEIPDANDRTRIAALADEVYVGASIASGVAREDGYFIQMREGPQLAESPPDFDRAKTTLAGLRLGDKMWRNDGEGWYPSDALPGVGLDPTTAKQLPKLLRKANDAIGARVELSDGTSHDIVTANGEVAYAPGLMAIDAAPFSVFAAPLQFAFDNRGRLQELKARIRNTNVEQFDLIVETIITFSYDGPIVLPEAEPTLHPAAQTDR